MNKCKKKTEVYSRVCGYFRPVQQFNVGKKKEYNDRKNYKAGVMEDGENYNNSFDIDDGVSLHDNQL